LESGDESKIKQKVFNDCQVFSDIQVFDNNKMSARSSPDFFQIKDFVRKDFPQIKDFLRKSSFDTNFLAFDESFRTQNQNPIIFNTPGSNCGGTHDDHFSGDDQDQDIKKTVLMLRRSSPTNGEGSPRKSKKLTFKGDRAKNFTNMTSRKPIYRMMVNGEEPELMQSNPTLKICNRPINALTQNLAPMVIPRKKSGFYTPKDEPMVKVDPYIEESNHSYSMSDSSIEGVQKDEGGNNIYKASLLDGVRDGYSIECKTILIGGIPNVYRHYRGHFSKGVKNGQGEYRVFKKANQKDICLAILCAETEYGKIIYGECEVDIEPYGKVLYKGSFNDSFEMHGSGSIFNIGNQILNISPINLRRGLLSCVDGLFF
jgi:hypothetical protein